MSAVQQVLASFGQERDPNYANVVALLHLDGSNGSGTFLDQKGHVFSAIGAATLSTAQSKFGSASLALNGSSQAISSATHADWEMGSGDFTFECWIRPNNSATGALQAIAERWATNGWFFRLTSTGKLNGGCTNTTSGTVQITGATTLASAAWQHVAFVRSGSSLMVFLEGVLESSGTFTGAINAVSDSLAVGYDNSGVSWFGGQIDEIRFTKGLARYTATFTPPVAAFPSF